MHFSEPSFVCDPAEICTEISTFDTFQATHVTFMCPMRFNKFPLDEHSCKFVVGSTNYDDTRMTFANDKLEYDPSAGNTILDYQVPF